MNFRTQAFIVALAASGAATAWAAEGLFVDSGIVKDVQRTLSDRGYRVGGVDGRMGPQTQAALRRFQRAERLEATGQLNHRTLVALGIQKGDAVASDEELHYDRALVRRAQQTLNSRGFHAGPVNGRIDERTHAALRQFQRSENLEDTGRLNERTLAALGVIPESASAGASRR